MKCCENFIKAAEKAGRVIGYIKDCPICESSLPTYVAKKPIKPTPKLPEKIGEDNYIEGGTLEGVFEEIKQIQIKFDKLIDYLEAKKGKGGKVK